MIQSTNKSRILVGNGKNSDLANVVSDGDICIFWRQNSTFFFGQNLDISAIVLFNNKLGEQWAEMPGVDGLCHDKVGPFLNWWIELKKKEKRKKNNQMLILFYSRMTLH